VDGSALVKELPLIRKNPKEGGVGKRSPGERLEEGVALITGEILKKKEIFSGEKAQKCLHPRHARAGMR